MEILFVLIGFFGGIVFLVLSIVNLIRRKPKKKSLIGLGICFALLVVGVVMSPTSPDTDLETQAEQEQEEVEEGSEEKVLTEEEKMSSELEGSIPGTFKGDNYSIITNKSSSSEEINIVITLDENRFIEDSWAGAIAISTLEGIKEYQPEIDDKVTSYTLSFYAHGEEQYQANFDNNNPNIEIALIDKNGEKLPQKTYDEYMAEVEILKTKAEEAELEKRIKNAIIDVVGTTNNMDNKSISDLKVNEHYGTDEEGDKLIIVNINASENLTNNMTKTGILIDSTDIFEKLFKISNVNEVTLNWDFPLVDQYGNTELGTIVTVVLDKGIADKINWKNFNKDNLTNVSKEYWEHPALSK